MGWAWRAAVGGSIGLGLLAACDAFSTGEEDAGKPDAATSTRGVVGSSSSSSGSTSSSGPSSSGGPAQLDGGGDAADEDAPFDAGIATGCSTSSCPDASLCDEFERINPDDSDGGWVYSGTLPKSVQFFHVEHDGISSCNGVFYALVDTPGGEAGASRILARQIVTTDHGIDLSFAFQISGSDTALVGDARVDFVTIFPSPSFSEVRPFIGLAMKNQKLVLTGDNGGSSVTLGAAGISPNAFVSVSLHFSTNGGQSYLLINGVLTITGNLPSLGEGTNFTLSLGEAFANTAALNNTLAARFDHLGITP